MEVGGVNGYVSRFLEIIPPNLSQHYKKSSSDFSRNCKLPFPKLITFVLSITSSGKSKGVDSKSGEFFKNARRSGLWPEAEAIHRSTLTKARKKVPWKVFEDILSDSVNLAYDLWPESPESLWKGMSVFAFDGSKDTLPATDEIRRKFDPKSGFQYSNKGHYPQCLVSTAYDVFRRLPIARTIVDVNGSEREEAKKMLPKIPPGNILMFDRGYPSYELINYIDNHYYGYYLFRCPASNTFPAVEKFLKGKKQEGVILINPSKKYKAKIGAQERQSLKPIKLRVIKLKSPDGTLSVLLTNLFNKVKFPKRSIIKLYSRRWEIETYYRDEKTVLEVEKFHSKTCNGIRQELYAIAIVSVISRALMILSSQFLRLNESDTETVTVGPQFKNAVMTLAAEAAVLTPDNPEEAINIFREVFNEIHRVKYYRPKIPRPNKPRVTKRAINRWCDNRAKKLTNA